MQNIEKLKYLDTISMAANKDYLTNLFNRRYFLEQVTSTFEDQKCFVKTNVLALLAIDTFKEINENIGHEMADNILIELSKLLSQHFKGNLTARFGGGEFSVLILDKNEKIIEDRLNQFRQIVAKHTVSVKETEHNFTVSIGSTIVQSKDSLKYILKEADKALQQAVGEGGNFTKMNGFIS
jgi:diguanylate cyclase (GGDEF)-like protein